MKKVIPGFICLLLLTTCGYEMPQSIVIKGNPGLYVPLGSPFAGMKEEERLENLISPDNIKKMMNAKTTEAGLYDDLMIYEVDRELAEALEIDPEVQTYLARYPMAEMPLDLKQYADKAMKSVNEKKQFTIPDVPALSGSYTYLTEDGPEETDNKKPFIKIPLKDMAKLVEWVERSTPGIFGLEFNYNSELAQYLELKIPGLGIDDWAQGVQYSSTEGSKLRYYKADKDKFFPRDQGDGINFSDLTDGNLLVYARISAPFVEQTLTPLMIFDWEKAKIDTTSDGTDSGLGSFTGEYSIDNNLRKFLGTEVSFKKVKGYVYMSGVKVNTSSMSIDILASDKSSIAPFPETRELKDVAAQIFPNNGIFNKTDGDILLDNNKMSLDKPLDLEKILNANGEKLVVAISIQGMEIKRADYQNNDTHIKFDLFILIPLELEVSEVTGEEAPNEIVNGVNIRDNYVPLDLGDALKKLGEGDLFGRKDGDDYLKYIEYVKISLKFSSSDINIIDPTKLAVLVITRDDNKLLEFKNNAFLKLDGNILETIPFSPEFTVLLAKDDKNPSTAGKEAFGSFKILRPLKPSFDFKLYVEAKAALEYTLDL